MTFNRDVAPIIFEHCTPCHRPGEAAPFNLHSYDDVGQRARQIVETPSHRLMPPWKPDPEFRHFEGALENLQRSQPDTRHCSGVWPPPYAATGQTSRAVTTAQAALQRAIAVKNEPLARELRGQLQDYEGEEAANSAPGRLAVK